jgi:flagellin
MESEIQKLKTEIAKRKSAITFNGKYLFSGGLSGKTIQIGPSNGTAFRLSIQIPLMSVTNIGGRSLSNVRVSQVTSAQNSIDLVNSAIIGLASLQTSIGAQEQSLERIINDLNAENVNMSAALSRIQDADMASEISTFVKQQIFSQAATAMIAQANALPQTVLKLLGIG